MTGGPEAVKPLSTATVLGGCLWIVIMVAILAGAVVASISSARENDRCKQAGGVYDPQSGCVQPYPAPDGDGRTRTP